ncbi:MAG: hypothetical protein NTZ40_11255 [Cyanobacteria bacterium]|nr:hypothetical protein [Cyanobacteriota bacterium]
MVLAVTGLVMALQPQCPRQRPGPPPSQKPCLPGAACPAASSEATRATDRLPQEALRRFNRGDPEGAVAALAPLGQTNPSAAAALQEALRSNWNRNRLEAARAQRLAAAGQWWEALDSLNRLDHPWWQRHTQALRLRVEQGAAALEQEHHQHSHEPPPAGIATERLDAEVKKRLQLGQPQWQAFVEGCAAVGGQVLEEGPEVNCVPRRAQQRP